MFTLVFFKINVMSILDRITQKPKEVNLNQLSIQEIEVLLSMIKRSNFLGGDIEHLYNLVVKLQNQYTEQTQ